MRLNLRRTVTSFCVLGVKFIDLRVARLASKVGLLSNSGDGFSKIFETCFVSETNFLKISVFQNRTEETFAKISEHVNYSRILKVNLKFELRVKNN